MRFSCSRNILAFSLLEVVISVGILLMVGTAAYFAHDAFIGNDESVRETLLLNNYGRYVSQIVTAYPIPAQFNNSTAPFYVLMGADNNFSFDSNPGDNDNDIGFPIDNTNTPFTHQIKYLGSSVLAGKTYSSYSITVGYF